MKFLLLVYISTGLITASDEWKQKWPACASAVLWTTSSGSLDTEPTIEKFVKRFEGISEAKPTVEYWLWYFWEMETAMTNCERRWCELASAVFDDYSNRHTKEGSKEAFDFVTGELYYHHNDLCNDGRYVNAYKVALNYSNIDPMKAPLLKVSSERGFSTCDQSRRSFSNKLGEHSQHSSDKNLKYFVSVVKQYSPGTVTCLEPFCVVGFRIANKLLLNSPADEALRASRNETLKAVLNFIKVNHTEACNPTRFSLIDTWKAQAGLEN